MLHICVYNWLVFYHIWETRLHFLTVLTLATTHSHISFIPFICWYKFLSSQTPTISFFWYSIIAPSKWMIIMWRSFFIFLENFINHLNLRCSDSPKMLPHPCRILQQYTTFRGSYTHLSTFLKSSNNIGLNRKSHQAVISF